MRGGAGMRMRVRVRVRVRRRRLGRFHGRHIVGHAGSVLSTVGRHAASVAPKAPRPGILSSPTQSHLTIAQRAMSSRSYLAMFA